MSYAIFLRDCGRWRALRLDKEDMNSHGMGDSKYEEMLERFKALSKQYELSIADVRLVLTGEPSGGLRLCSTENEQPT